MFVRALSARGNKKGFRSQLGESPTFLIGSRTGRFLGEDSTSTICTRIPSHHQFQPIESWEHQSLPSQWEEAASPGEKIRVFLSFTWARLCGKAGQNITASVGDLRTEDKELSSYQELVGRRPHQ